VTTTYEKRQIAESMAKLTLAKRLLTMRVLVREAYPLSVTIESFVNMGKALAPGETELEMHGDTLLDLLLTLNEKYSFTLGAQLVDPQTGRVVNYDVFVNGRYFENSPNATSNIKLKGGDEVTISLAAIWGG
jgi:hypothetical protein